MLDHPSWHFPARGWGLDVIQDSSSTHFRDDPIPKLVREVLQNSLDANDKNLAGPVSVTIAERYVPSQSIGADELAKHVESCLTRAVEEDRASLRKFYEQASRAVQSEQIRCLQVIDSGTLGLKGRAWNALVFQEGSVEKPGSAPGGSNGVGKNAVLNVSDFRTVFYSTRYVQLREGRIEKFQGKATLMDHRNPLNESEKSPTRRLLCDAAGRAGANETDSGFLPARRSRYWGFHYGFQSQIERLEQGNDLSRH